MPETGEGDLKRQFELEESERLPLNVRVACALGICAFVAYYALDFAVGADLDALFVARTAIVACHVAIIGWTFSASARRYPRIVAVLPLLAIGIGVAIVTQMVGGGTSRYHEAILITFFACPLVVPMRPLAAGTAMVAVVLFYDLLLLWTNTTGPVDVWVSNNFALWLSVVVATVGVALVYRYRWSVFLAKARLSTATNQLAAANKQLQQLTSQRTRFFQSMSHELRSPLMTIKAPVESMLQGEFQGNAQLSIVHRNTQRLSEIVDDLLEVAKLDEAGITLSIGKVDVGTLVRGVSEAITPRANAKRLTLTCTVPEEPVTADGDAHRLKMVVRNLIDNAIKYTPEGRRVQVRVVPADGAVRIEVEDHGDGISEENQARIFNRFMQVGDRSEGGVGIGLSLAHELVTLHGGTVSVQSTLGQGTTFTASLPLEAAGSTEQSSPTVPRGSTVNALSEHRNDPAGIEETQDSAVLAPTPPPPGNKPPKRRLATVPPPRGARGTVLVTDDIADNRTIMRGWLEPDYHVLEAEDGLAALEVLRNESVDLLVTDVQMPRMSGPELVQALRAEQRFVHLPVIVITAQSSEMIEVQALKEHGANDYLPKGTPAAVFRARVDLQFKLRRLTVELASKEKLAALGTLAAGILHEINNPTVAISGVANYIDNDTVRDIVENGSRRILRLTGAFRTQLQPAARGRGARPMEIAPQLNSTTEIIRAAMSEHRFEVSIDCAPDVTAMVPPEVAGTVLLNLLENAVKSGADQIVVRADESKGTVRVFVQDNGPGIPEQDRSQLFDPFFTTREVGSGTGLGLFMARRMCEASGGTLELVGSESGSHFLMTLPAAYQRTETQAS